MRLHKHFLQGENPLLQEILRLPRSKWPGGVGGRGKVPQDPQFWNSNNFGHMSSLARAPKSKLQFFIALT